MTQENTFGIGDEVEFNDLMFKGYGVIVSKQRRATNLEGGMDNLYQVEHIDFNLINSQGSYLFENYKRKGKSPYWESELSHRAVPYDPTQELGDEDDI